MAIDPRIGLSPVMVPSVSKALNIYDNALLSAEARKQRELEAPMRKRLLEAQTQQAEQGVTTGQQAIEQEKQNSIIRSIAEFSPIIKPLLENAVKTGDTAEAQAALNQRLIQLQKQGRDTTETVEAITQLRNGNPQQVLAEVNAIDAAAQQRGLTPRQAAVTGTASQRDFDTYNELKAKAAETGSKADQLKAEQFGRQAGFVRETAQEKADIRVSEAGQKETAKAISKRKQGFVDSGVEAADSVRNIKRSLELLDTVKTGGFDNAAFRIKQFFGVEGADEGELSANLGISVLSQLKPIFGAAFTAAEGERLERISARFGANPETNKRLLNETLRIAERAAKRGISAAEESGDDFTANEIKSALEFVEEAQDIQAETSEPAQATEPVSIEYQEGMTATGPNGQKAVYQNGEWVISNG